MQSHTRISPNLNNLYIQGPEKVLFKFSGRIYKKQKWWEKLFKFPLKQRPIMELEGENLFIIDNIKVLKNTELFRYEQINGN